MRRERCPEAIAALQRALELDSTFVNGWINLATCHQIQDQPGAALEAYGRANRLDTVALRQGNLNQEFGRVYVRLGRLAAADSIFQGMLSRSSPNDQARGHRSLGFLRMYEGRYGAAITHFREAAVLSRQTGTQVSELRNRTLLAEALVTANRQREAQKELDRAHHLLAVSNPEAAYQFYVGHAWLRVGRTDRARALLTRLEAEARPGDPFDQSALRLFRGFLALAERRPRDAIEAAADDRHPPFAGYRHAVRADAYAALGQFDSATAAAQELMAGYHFGFDSHDQWLRGPLRVGRLAEGRGDSALARAAYSGYVERWAMGDSTLPELRFARSRLATLQEASAR
jgi:tetratricopeptide (TPR) repeat protein